MVTNKLFFLLAITIPGVWTQDIFQDESPCNAYGFSCISDSEFRLCGASNNTHLCPEGMQCSSIFSGICIGDPSSRLYLATDIAFECNESGFFLDPNSECKSYFICIENPDGDGVRKIPSTCPNEWLFDQESQICKNASEVECPDPPTCNPYGFYCVKDNVVQFCEGDVQNPSGPTQNCTSNRICKQNCIAHCILPELEENLCPASTEFECKEEGIFPDINNCSAFIICVQNGDQLVQINVTCPEETAFDNELKICTKEAYANCSGTDPSDFNCSEEGFFPVPDDCYSFYICTRSGEDLVKLNFTCPSGSAFDNTLKTCTKEAYANCSGNGEQACPREGFFPAPNDCYSFIICTRNGDKFDQLTFQCPDGSAFDSELETCTEEAYGRCNGNTPFECTRDGFFRNPANCRSFIICSSYGNSFIQLPFQCPEGYAFDSNAETCTVEALVNCTN